MENIYVNVLALIKNVACESSNKKLYLLPIRTEYIILL